MELQNGFMLVKADLRRKAETLAQTQAGRHQLPPTSLAASTTPGSCKKRGCMATNPRDAENRPPQKRPFFQSLFPACTPTRKYNTRAAEEAACTPYSQILRARQQTPPPSPVSTPRSLRGKYWADLILCKKKNLPVNCTYIYIYCFAYYICFLGVRFPHKYSQKKH